MNRHDVRGVILAAGRGKRIAPHSQHYPKPLLPVCNRPVMQYQMEALRDAGVRDVVIVIGHLGEQIRDAFGDGSAFGVGITYVFDPRPAGIASSLLSAEREAGERFIVLLGDIFYSIANLSSCVAAIGGGGVDAAIVAVEERTPEPVRRNFAIVCDEDGRIVRLVEKPQDPPSLVKGVGIYAFTRAIFDAIRRTPRSALRGEYELTDAIQVLIDGGAYARTIAMDGWEFNVTFPADLLATNLRLLREQGTVALIGEGAWIHPDAALHNVVAGPGVRIDNAMTIEDCVLLEGATICGDGRHVRRAIIGPGVEYVVAGEALEKAVTA